jgi:DNA-directed RNA polymerase specialized sigma24 family protein
MKINKEEPIIKKQEKPKRKKQEKPHYVNARDFENALIQYYDDDKITNYIGESIQKIATGLSYAPNFINYSYKDEMVGDAIVKMYQAVLHKKFKLNKGFSPFGYFTTIAYHAFICRIKKEKKHYEVVEEYKERHFDLMIQNSEDFSSHKVYTRPAPLDRSDYSF